MTRERRLSPQIRKDPSMTDTTRKIVLIQPAGAERQERFYRELTDVIPGDRIEHGLQLGMPREMWPDAVTKEEFAAEAVRRFHLFNERSWRPDFTKPWDYIMPDIEPEADDDHDFGWQWRNITEGIDKASTLAIEEMMKQLRPLSPDSKFFLYGNPRPPVIGRISEERQKAISTHDRMLRSFDAVPLHLYPTHGNKPQNIANRAVTSDNVMDHVNRALHGHEVLSQFGLPQLPMFWPRWGMDNGPWFTVYLRALNFKFDINRIIIWLNPHNDTMHNVYMRELLEGSDAILDWLGV